MHVCKKKTEFCVDFLILTKITSNDLGCQNCFIAFDKINSLLFPARLSQSLWDFQKLRFGSYQIGKNVVNDIQWLITLVVFDFFSNSSIIDMIILQQVCIGWGLLEYYNPHF